MGWGLELKEELGWMGSLCMDPGALMESSCSAAFMEEVRYFAASSPIRASVSPPEKQSFTCLAYPTCENQGNKEGKEATCIKDGLYSHQ